MQKQKKRWLFAALSALAFVMLLAVGCSGPAEENKTAKLVLDPGYGTLSETELDVAPGSLLSEALKDLTPTPETGLLFGGWFSENGKEIEEGATMPESGLSLTAKYLASYTVNVYYEGEDGSFGEPETQTGTAWYREPFTYRTSAEHFELDGEHEGSRIASSSLGKDEVFTAYLMRETYRIVYYPNIPSGQSAEGSMSPVSVRYGQSAQIAASSYTISAEYRFAGWAAEADGGVEYRPGDQVTPQSDLTLYAVWDRAYIDRFGGYDAIFLPSGEERVAVLVRPGLGERRGTVDGNGIFVFTDGEEILRGRIGANRKFSYYRAVQQAVVYSHLNAYTDTLADDGATLTFDGYDRGVYTENGQAREGTYSFDPETSLYGFVYDGGTEGFEFFLETLPGEETPVYLRQGEEANLYLGLSLAGNAGEDSTYTDLLYLDGFGGLAMYDIQTWYAENTYTAIAAGSYVPKGESEIEAEVSDVNGDFTLRCLLATYDGTPTWFRYREEASGEFVNGGAVLTLDGYGYSAQSGSYRPEEGREQYGMFTVEEGWLGTIVRFTVGSGTNASTTVFRLGDGTFETVGGAGYGEYLKLGEDGRTGAPLLILDGEGGAQLWTSASVHAADGKVTEEDGRFVYTETRLLTGDLPASFPFTLRRGLFEGQEQEIGVYLIYEAEKVTALTGPNGSTLTYDPYGYAVYSDGDSEMTGRYFILRDPALYPDLGFSILEFYGDDGSYFNFRLDGNSFRPLTGTGTYERFVNDFTEKTPAESLFLSGDGYAAHTVDGVTVGGSYTLTGEKGVFTPKEGDPFEFVILHDESGTYYFARHTSLWEGELVLTLKDGKETLTLDGYGEIFSSSGSRGTYYISSKLSNGLLRFFVTDGTADAYFDVDLKGKLYTDCGYEIGEYFVYRNGTYGDSQLVLDGYGSAVFYEISSGTASRVWEAKYEWYDLGQESLTLTFDNGETTHVRIWGLFDGEEIVSLCTFEYASAGTYASQKWEVLEIGMFGDAVYYDRFGQAEVGTAEELGADVVCFQGEEERYYVLKDGSFEEKSEGFLISGGTLLKYLGGEEEIVIPANVTEIADRAFSRLVMGSNYDGAAIISLDLANVVTVGLHAFDGCSLLKSVRGEKVETLAGYNFYACLELTEVDLPSLKTVGDYAFWRCESLQRIELPKAETFGYGAFGQCHALAGAELPAAVTVEDGAFYDCFALARAAFGSSLVRLGSENAEMGVFDRTEFESDQVPLTVALAGLPQIGSRNLFGGVSDYRIELPSLETLLSLYKTDAWADYAPRAGIPTEKDGVYSRNISSLFAALDLNVIATYGARYQAAEVLGAYNVEEGMLAVYTYAPETAEKYVRTVRGKFTETGIAFDADGYGPDYEAYWDPYFGPDKRYELNEFNDSGEKLCFTLNAAETFSIPAEYTDEEGTMREVSLVSYRNSDGALVMYFDFEGNRYNVEVIGNPANYFEYTVSFVPIVTYYTAADGSMLVVTQNDEAGENFSFSAILAGVAGYTEFRIENKTPVFTSENAFTAEFVQESVSYRFAFTFNFEEKSFSYSYEAEGQTVLTSEDKAYRLTVTIKNGEVSKLLVESYYDPGYEDHSGAGYVPLSNAFFKPLGGDVYGYYVYGEEYAEYGGYARYLITLTFDGGTVSAFELQKSGTALRAFMRGPNYAYLYFDEEGAFDGAALFLLGADGRNVYVPHTAENVDGFAKLVTLTVEEGAFANTYYVDYADPSNASLVRATTEYAADTDYGDLEGSATVTRDPMGGILSASLTVKGETITAYLPLPEEDYYLFCGTAYYRVRITASDLRIYALSEREVAGMGATADVLLDADDRLVYVLSVTAGEELSATFAVVGDPSDKTYAITAGEGETRRYFLLTTDGVPALEEASANVYVTADGNYRVTVLFNAEGEAVTVLALGVKNASGGYNERTITEVLGQGEFTVTVVPTGNYTGESYTVTLTESGSGYTVTVTRFAY